MMEINMKDLSLVEKEEDGLAYDVEKDPDVSSNVELCLMGHFLADKVIRVSPMKERIIDIWWPGKGALIREIPRVYLCSSSMIKVLNDQFFVKLFDLENNVGHKEWGLDFRVKVKKGEGGSQWLWEEGKDWNSIEINHTRFSRTMNIVTKDLNSERFLVVVPRPARSNEYHQLEIGMVKA
ncbi:hypothetical protein D0Y65_006821 [Glycine soja]|uniref:DUF4283 domain-containing protein n=1 Tax=Glycine soja TaxID=3848 RepID=A0A445LAJ9_GLYSO|nr:hypothetical protein D0Y65_006821 [Glycine soja]